MATLISQLDTVVIATNDLAGAVDDYAALTAIAPQEQTFRGGAGVSFQLANVRLMLVETSDRQGLQQLVFGCDHLATARSRLPKVGIDVDEAGSNDEFVQLSTECTRGANFALVPRRGIDAQELASPGALSGIDHAVIGSGDGDYTASVLSGRLQLDLRLDLSNADWDARLLFFRCGDMIVEVYQSLSKPLPPESDRFFGLSWRTNDIDATQAELSQNGFDVSEVRVGRRPGTRVCTVRDRTHGVPTLILGRDALAT